MDIRVPIAIVTSVLVAMAAAACGGDSTGPTNASVALHIDSLYEQTESSDMSDGAKFSRGITLTSMEFPAAYGAHPTAVDVHTASGIERWHGLEYSSPMAFSDGAFHSTLVLYRDTNVQTALVVDYNSSGSFATLLTNDTLGLIETSGTGSSTETHVDGSCATPPTLENPLLHINLSSVCSRERFAASLSAEMTTDARADPALSHIEFTATAIEGVHFSGM